MAWRGMDFGNRFILPEQHFPFRAGCFEESLSTCKLKFPEPRAKVIRAYTELSREGIRDLLCGNGLRWAHALMCFPLASSPLLPCQPSLPPPPSVLCSI